MLQKTNRIFVFVALGIYVLLFKFLLFPVLTGVQSNHNLQHELIQLQSQRDTRLQQLKAFEQLKEQWGTKLYLTQNDLLPFLLTHLEQEKLHLLDFTEEFITADAPAQPIARFKIELQGTTNGTLRLLNALEHSFPFATIHELKMQQKKKRKQKTVYTHFYLQQ